MQEVQTAEIYTFCEKMEQEGRGSLVLWLHRVATTGPFLCYTMEPYHFREVEETLGALAADHFPLDEDAYKRRIYAIGEVVAESFGRSTFTPRFITLKDRLRGVYMSREGARSWLKDIKQDLPLFWFGDAIASSQPPAEPDNLAIAIPTAPLPPAAPEQIAAEGRRCRKPAVDIAAEILQHYPNIGTRELGTLVPANPGADISPESEYKQGWRLKKALE